MKPVNLPFVVCQRKIVFECPKCDAEMDITHLENEPRPSQVMQCSNENCTQEFFLDNGDEGELIIVLKN